MRPKAKNCHLGSWVRTGGCRKWNSLRGREKRVQGKGRGGGRYCALQWGLCAVRRGLGSRCCVQGCKPRGLELQSSSLGNGAFCWDSMSCRAGLVKDTPRIWVTRQVSVWDFSPVPLVNLPEEWRSVQTIRLHWCTSKFASLKESWKKKMK